MKQYLEIIQQVEKQPRFLFESNVLTGFSSLKMISALQHFTQLKSQENPENCYLEVGVFQGLTLLSVAGANPTYPCYGIDNFNFFDKDGKNMGIVKSRTEQLGLQNAYLLNYDYEDTLEHLDRHLGNKKVAVYFIDGPHDYRSQLVCLLLIKPFLADNAIIIVDDANYRHVRQANRDFLMTHPEFKLLHEAYTYTHPTNMPAARKHEALQGWWDGVNIIVKDTNNQLQAMYPQTHRSRELYENEHLIHPSKAAEVAPDLLRAFNAMLDGNVLAAMKSFGYAIKKHKKVATEPRYNDINTYSEQLQTRTAVLQ